jgi:carbamoyltransferase
LILKHLVKVFDDGSIWLNHEYFSYSYGLKMTRDSKWTKLFGISPRKPETDISQEYCDLALAIQSITEDIVMKMAREAWRLTQCCNLVLAGGVALNCVSNGKILHSGLFKDIWIQPAAGDAGGALGAAFAVHHLYCRQPRILKPRNDSMKGSYLGPEYHPFQIESMAKKFGAVFIHLDDTKLCKTVARLLASGKVVGWHQGRMEWGPRALGNRSILGDARNPEMQKKLNLKIKFRESFRPFAPSVLFEDCGVFFDHKIKSPYMLLVTGVNKKRRKPLPKGYNESGMSKKLYFERSDIPAVTHLDYSARVQTVHKETNERFYRLIHEFKKITKYGIIINTSFNVRGEPIVCTPEDSYRCFMRTEMDYLIIGNYLFNKVNQPPWHETINWKKQYVLD